VSNTVEGFRSEVGSESSAVIYLDSRIYGKEAVLKASYWFTDVAYISFPECPDHNLAVEIKLKSTQPSLENPKPISIENLIAEFCNSLLDFELRHQIDVETAPVRQLILAKAFSESGILEDEPPGSVADPVEVSKPTSLVQILNSPKI
jgi:His-Xaa-Ser system protein HxsD